MNSLDFSRWSLIISVSVSVLFAVLIVIIGLITIKKSIVSQEQAKIARILQEKVFGRDIIKITENLYKVFDNEKKQLLIKLKYSLETEHLRFYFNPNFLRLLDKLVRVGFSNYNKRTVKNNYADFSNYYLLTMDKTRKTLGLDRYKRRLRNSFRLYYNPELQDLKLMLCSYIPIIIILMLMVILGNQLWEKISFSALIISLMLIFVSLFQSAQKTKKENQLKIQENKVESLLTQVDVELSELTADDKNSRKLDEIRKLHNESKVEFQKEKVIYKSLTRFKK